MNVQIFENAEFGELRTVEKNGKILFVASDVAKVLGYSNPRDAISRHCKGVAKHDILTNGGKQSVSIISEGDVYRLIAHSKLPAAERFESWVFDTVLPTIRKTGSYSTQPADNLKAKRLEVMQRNANAKVAKLWLQISNNTQNQTYKEICNAYAANVLAEKEILALPAATEKTYSAAEIGKMLDISASMVGRIANANGLKTEEYGAYYHDKSRYSNKEVETFRYYECAIDAFQKIIAAKGGDDYVA